MEYVKLFVLMTLAVTVVSSIKPKSKKELETLVDTEKKLYHVLNNYTNHLEQRLIVLKKYHEEFNRAFEEASNGVEEYLDNPVNAFLFSRRLLVTWKEVEKVMSGDVGRDWARDLQLQRYLKGLKLPSKDDMSYAAGEVKKLQDTYQLNATEMAQGGPYGIILNSGDCFELGKEAYEAEDFEHSYDWLQEAWNRVGDGRSDERDIVEYMAAVAYYKGRIRKALELTRRLLQLYPNHDKAKGNIKYYTQRLAQMEKDRAKALKQDVIEGILNWQPEDLEDLKTQMCNRSVTISPKVQSKLRCRLTHNENPLLRLSPLQEEDAFLNPRVVLYHDVLTNKQVEDLKNIARPRLFTQDHDETTATQQAFLSDVGIDAVEKVNKRGTQVSGLNLTHSDILLALNFKEGEAMKIHVDHQESGTPMVRKAGNKLGTLYFFLDDSEGGDIVFPSLKLAVTPRKGSVLFWYNLLDNGLSDDLSVHGTCAFQSSENWAAIKWIRSYGNEFTRPCNVVKKEPVVVKAKEKKMSNKLTAGRVINSVVSTLFN